MKRWCQQNDNDDDDDEKSVNVNSLAKLIDAVNNAKMFCQQILSFRKRQELQVFIRYNLIEKCWETPERERKRERWWNVWQRIQAKYLYWHNLQHAKLPIQSLFTNFMHFIILYFDEKFVFLFVQGGGMYIFITHGFERISCTVNGVIYIFEIPFSVGEERAHEWRHWRMYNLCFWMKEFNSRKKTTKLS